LSKHNDERSTRDYLMTLGVGTDLIEISRIERAIARHGQRFLRRVFTSTEIEYCTRKKNAAESYASRFAAKEAAAKALGTGISRGVSWLEFEVTREPGRRPEIRFHGRASSIAVSLGVKYAALSLTHSRELAMAVVILE